MKFTDFLVESESKLKWTKGFEEEPDDIDMIVFDDPTLKSDWDRFSKDLCDLLQVKAKKKIWWINSDEQSLSEGDLYEKVFQEVFGVSAEHSNNKNYVCPKGYTTKKKVKLDLYSTSSNDKDAFDHGGDLIFAGRGPGMPILFISYPDGAGIVFYWAKRA
jgi:hypothetical protein